jgi:hypothetical protein
VLGLSTIRRVTEGHARARLTDGDEEPAWPTQAGAAIIIAESDGGQVDTRFGTQGTYTVDFFHVCDSLTAAAKHGAPDDPRSCSNARKNFRNRMIVPWSWPR